MTDPTPEQIEAAAKAMNEASSGFFSEGPWRHLAREALAAAGGVTPQEPAEPTYSIDTGQWSGSCPCIRAEQVDPECEWHGRPEFRRGGVLHSGAPSGDMVAKAARVLHIATCCKLSEESEHQEPQNEDLFTAGVVLNAVPVSAPVQVDEAKLVEITRSTIDRRPYSDDTRREIRGLENAVAREVTARRSEWLRGGGR